MSNLLDSDFLVYFPLLGGSGCQLSDMIMVDEVLERLDKVSLETCSADTTNTTLAPIGGCNHGVDDKEKENVSDPRSNNCTRDTTTIQDCCKAEVSIAQPNISFDIDPPCEGHIASNPAQSPDPNELSIMFSETIDQVREDNEPSLGSNDTFLDDDAFVRTQRQPAYELSPKAHVRYKQQPLAFNKAKPGEYDAIESKPSSIPTSTALLSRRFERQQATSEDIVSAQNKKCRLLIEMSQALKACTHPLAVIPYQSGDSITAVQAQCECSLPMLIETLAHLDERKGREGDRGPRALFLGAGAKNSSIQGGILIVTPKAKVAAWASLIKNIPDVSLHVQASLSLSQRRKNGAERLARFDVVLTTYDLVRAKEVAMPVRCAASSSSRHSSIGGSTCSTPQSMSNAGSDAGFLSPLATESGAGAIPGGTADCSLLHLVKWNFILTDDSPESGVNMKLSTAKGAAMRTLQHLPSRIYNARESATSIPRMLCLFPSSIPTVSLVPELDGDESSSSGPRAQLLGLMRASGAYLGPLLQLHRIGGQHAEETIVILPQHSNI